MSIFRQKAAECVAAMTLMGCLPLLFWHFAGLMERPHYQFVILLPVGAWLLSMSETVTLSRPRANSTVALATYLLGLLIVLGASLVWSPWLGYVGVMMMSLPCLYWIGGQTGLESWWRPWMLFWAALPLPFGIDQDLIYRLRDVTTSLTSQVLDVIGVLHGLSANIIKLPNKSLYIADACSGIHSLFVLLATALFLALWNRRHLLHSLTLIACSLGIVLFENVARLVTVAYAFRWKMDLSEGRHHTMLGVILFCLSLFLVITTDQFLKFLLPLDFMSGVSKRSPIRAASSTRQAAQSWEIAQGLAIVCVLVGVVQLIKMPHRLPELTALTGDNLHVPAFGKELFAGQLEGWELVDYKELHRVEGDPLGRDSQQWVFHRGSLSATVSLDLPYYEYHDLTLCYSQMGWSIAESEVWDSEKIQEEISPEVLAKIGPNVPVLAYARMTSKLDGNGLLFFSQCDAGDRYHAILSEVGRVDGKIRSRQRLQSFWKGLDHSQSNASTEDVAVFPVIQFQAVARTEHVLSKAHRDEVALFYLQTRQILADKCRSVLRPGS